MQNKSKLKKRQYSDLDAKSALGRELAQRENRLFFWRNLGNFGKASSQRYYGWSRFQDPRTYFEFSPKVVVWVVLISGSILLFNKWFGK